jgi:hypothetical protein
MFCNHETKYIKEKRVAKFIQTPGKSGEIVVNTGFLPNLRKHHKDPSNADLITLRNRAWRKESPPNYFFEPKQLETETHGDDGFWTYWEHNVS